MPPISLTDEELFAIWLCRLGCDTSSSDDYDKDQDEEEEDDGDDNEGNTRNKRTRQIDSSADRNKKRRIEDSSELHAR